MNAVQLAPAVRVRWPTPPAIGPTGAVPNTQCFVRLLKAFIATGGTAPGEVMSEMLKDHRRGDLVTLARLIASRQIFSFDWRGGVWLPMFQFDPVDLSAASPPQKIRAELPAAFDGWAVACWFAEPHGMLDGRLPCDVVGADLHAVRDAARASRIRLQA